eukprot:TRINITY_DN11644_c0_g1_i1.p1 TRINITY_DN11644_c0_g1~~TRINITY_DN11644_c0_g1_i1.p1  ORF type:complete len:272 (+),score=71.77 TRINITY_DN11644_c0_g1_i1:70-885(+)
MTHNVGHCSPTSIYGWLVQLCIGIVGMSSILFKWSMEKPRRSVITLLLDVSKQIVGGFITHFTKVGFSVIINHLSHDDCDPEKSCCDTECIAYVVQSTFQALLVIPPAFLMLRLFVRWATKREWKLLVPFGDYYAKPGVYCKKRVAAQLGIWAFIMGLCNAIVEACFFIPLRDQLNDAGRFLLSWVRCADHSAELWVVILGIPMFIDTMQYLVYDCIIAHKPRPPAADTENGSVSDGNSETRSLLSDVVTDVLTYGHPHYNHTTQDFDSVN